MTIILILFFVSLFVILIMISRKLFFIRESEIIIEEKTSIIPEANEIKYLLIKNAKKYGFVMIAIILRTTVRTNVLVKRKVVEISNRIKNHLYKNTSEKRSKKEVNGFLKGMSEYKKKIRRLKDKIVEEEMDS